MTNFTKVRLSLGLCLCLAGASANAASELFCLTGETNPTIEAQISSALTAHSEGEDEHHRIVIQYNVLRRADGSGGFTQLDLIDEHMKFLNWGFRDTPFVFVRIPGVRYIDDDSFYHLQTIDEAHLLYSTYHTLGVANIFFHEPQLFNLATARSYTSPNPPSRGHTYGDTRIGLPANVAYSPHELGHFFFLFHPSETAFSGIECADSRNCDTAGDLVCDTPGSPAVHGGNTLRTGEYFGNTSSPCINDSPYAPLTDLWMEFGWQYGDPGALIRDRFTPGQVERMEQTLHSLSADLIGPQRPDVLVDCDGDLVDDIDEILSGMEADINEDKVPDRCQNFLRTGDLLVSGMNGEDTNTPRFFDPLTGAFRGGLRTGASWAHQMRLGPDGLIYIPSIAVILRIDPVTGYLVDNLVDGNPDGTGTVLDILFDAAGDLLLLDNSNAEIRRYSRETGDYLGLFSATGLTAPKYMEFGPDGNIYVVGNGAGDNRVARIDARTGAVIGDFVSPGSGGLSGGQGLVFHDDGYLYVSNANPATVLRYDAESGNFDRKFVSEGDNGNLDNPHSLRFGPDGHLYVASRGSDAVKRYHGTTGAYLDDFIPAGSGGPAGTGTIDQPAGLLFAKISGGTDINAGMSGAWTNLETLGQGFFFDVIESQKRMFAGWFSYETDIGIVLGPGDNEKRWLVAVGHYFGDTAHLELLEVHGGTFNGPDAVTETPVGTATLQFLSCTEAELSYELGGLQGTITLNRLLPDALCGELSE